MAQGDLRARIEDPIFDGEFAPLRDAFNHSASRLNEALSAVASNSDLISTGAAEISTASDDLAKRTEKQAANLGQAASSVRTITEGVQSNAKACADANAESQQALEKVKAATTVMTETTKAMDGIKSSSDAIGEIISVIDGIASRPTFWPSTQVWKPPVRVKPDAGLPWLRRKCARWPNSPLHPPARSSV